MILGGITQASRWQDERDNLRAHSAQVLVCRRRCRLTESILSVVLAVASQGNGSLQRHRRRALLHRVQPVAREARLRMRRCSALNKPSSQIFKMSGVTVPPPPNSEQRRSLPLRLAASAE